ncbi:hypothetical protein O181_043670 [Austropuccinia psidii MF-1]|uniref:Uncharacterized protein n=1 Tax=Austropuccinia psidii MF-1 TaxID=1389203 RepID=A0A9Q3DIR5_9BASI|nr:hypothetical protein [Austropuccinia psidii MF-1]
MASSGHFNPSQTYDGYKAVEFIYPACNECLMKGKECFQNLNTKCSKFPFCFVGKKPGFCPGMLASNVKRYLLSKKAEPFGKEFPVSEAPTPDVNSGYSRCIGRWPGGPIGGNPIYSSSEVPNLRFNTAGSEEVEVVLNSAGHQFSTSPSQPPAKRFQSQACLGFNSETIPHSSAQKLPYGHIPTAPTFFQFSRRREDQYPLLLPASQVFQKREHWPIPVTREDPNMASEGQEDVARLLRRVDKKSKEMIMYSNDRTIPGTDSEEMATKLSWYEDELINDFQRTFDDLGRNN